MSTQATVHVRYMHRLRFGPRRGPLRRVDAADRVPPQEVRLAGGGNLYAHVVEALRARRRADVWPAGLLRRNARVPLSDAVSRDEATAGDLDAELEVCAAGISPADAGFAWQTPSKLSGE